MQDAGVHVVCKWLCFPQYRGLWKYKWVCKSTYNTDLSNTYKEIRKEGFTTFVRHLTAFKKGCAVLCRVVPCMQADEQ